MSENKTKPWGFDFSKRYVRDHADAKLGTFEEEEFKRSGYKPSKERPWARSKEPERKRKCLNCDEIFLSYAKNNRICPFCRNEEKFQIPAHGYDLFY